METLCGVGYWIIGVDFVVGGICPKTKKTGALLKSPILVNNPFCSVISKGNVVNGIISKNTLIKTYYC